MTNTSTLDRDPSLAKDASPLRWIWSHKHKEDLGLGQRPPRRTGPVPYDLKDLGQEWVPFGMDIATPDILDDLDLGGAQVTLGHGHLWPRMSDVTWTRIAPPSRTGPVPYDLKGLGQEWVPFGMDIVTPR